MSLYTEQDVRAAHSAASLCQQARRNGATVPDYAASLDIAITEPHWAITYARGTAILREAVLHRFAEGDAIPPADSPVVWLQAGYTALAPAYHAYTLTRKAR